MLPTFRYSTVPTTKTEESSDTAGHQRRGKKTTALRQSGWQLSPQDTQGQDLASGGAWPEVEGSLLGHGQCQHGSSGMLWLLSLQGGLSTFGVIQHLRFLPSPRLTPPKWCSPIQNPPKFL